MRTAVFLFLLLCSLAQAAEQPEYPGLDLPERYTVVVKGHTVNQVFWRNGRPFGTWAELGPTLSKPLDTPGDVDILMVVKSMGYVAELKSEGLVLSPAPKAYVPPPAWAQNEPGGYHPPRSSGGQSSKGKQPGPDLTYHVKSFTAETGYVRAYVLIVNEGDGASLPTRARAYFTDWFGKPFASDWYPIPGLEPGESTKVMEFFSLVTEREANEKSMNYQVEIRFDVVTDPKTGRKVTKQTKKSKLQQQMILDREKPTWSLPKGTGTP